MKGNLGMQLLLLLLIVTMVFSRVIPLEMQKRIVNESIALGKLDSLLIYCAIYLLAVTTTAGIKLAINYLQVLIGERAMLAMRRELYAHIISLPLQFFRSTQPGMVVSSLMTELSTAGSFAGMALAVPISNILTLLAFAAYLLWLNPKLAMATLGIYPIVAFLIPYLQKKVNRLNKQRVDQSRLVSSQIAESITGVTEISVHGAYAQEKSKFNSLVEGLRNIRTTWSLLRFSIKTINNYFSSIGPFVVFLFGGYLVMQGQLELGSLVAFLSAQEKLYDPWKELIEYYQVYEDASVRYYRTMHSFDIAAEHRPEIALDSIPELKGNLKVTNLGYTTRNGTVLLKGVTFSLAAGENLALVGFSGSGKSTLLNCIAKMFDYNSGSILLDDREVKEIRKNEIIQHIGYISQHPFIFSGTMRENLLYTHRAANTNGPASKEEYHPPELDQLILALQQAGIFVDVIRFGLNSFLTTKETEMIAKIIRIRKQFRKDYSQSLEKYIEFYREDRYMYHSDIAENIVFGTPLDSLLPLSSLATSLLFRTFLDRTDLTEPLLSLGVDLTKQYVDNLSGLGDLDPFLPTIPITGEKGNTYRILLERLGESSPNHLPPADQASLLTLALLFTPGSRRPYSIQPTLEKNILQGRKSWKEWREKVFPGKFNSFQETAYIHGQSILNNILFGRIKTEQISAQEEISQNIIRLLIEEDCLESIAEAGMDYHIGSMGNRLSGGQKQKLAIARVLLKDAKIILMDESTSALDNQSQSRIQRLIEHRWQGERTVIAVVHRLDSIEGFNKIGVMKDGQLMEYGEYPQLISQKGLLYELVFGKKEWR